jgi:hypothetical protein
MLRLRSLPALALLGLSLIACKPAVDDAAPPVSPSEATPSGPARPTVDAQNMYEAIAWLASDELQGRFTLAEEIEQVATWLSERHTELGLEPVPGAEAMRVAYRLRIKVEAGETQALIVERSGKPKPVAASQFTPRAEGAAGTAKGEVVFAGYAVQWTAPEPVPEESEPEAEAPADAPAIASFDELAGVDLNGKIALVFAHAPNTPDLMALFAAMQGVAETFEAAASPAREADDRAKLAKLHQQARQQLVDLVAPFVDTKDLGDGFWKVEDPTSGLDIMTLASVFATRTSARPQFDPREVSLSKKVERLAAAGAVGVIIVEGPRSFLGSAARKQAKLPGVIDAPMSVGESDSGDKHVRVIADPAPIPVVQLRWTEADKLFRVGGKPLSQVQAAIDGDYQPRSAALGVQAEITTDLRDEHREVPNVLAQIRGETDEIILIGAHFDHIGNEETGQCRAVVKRDDRDAICNGADDNGSGTAMLLELARAYKASGITPKRTLVFAHFSGEELGLLGSKALIEASPFDQGQVVAMVNLDMVGRLGPKGLAVGGIFSSPDWMPLLDELGNYGMRILYEGSTTTRSDHAWWFRRDIPVLFFFTGVHPDYHRAGDELDKINVEGLGQIGQLVSDVVWELAGGRKIEWSAPEGGGIGRGLPGSDPSTVIREVLADG